MNYFLLLTAFTVSIDSLVCGFSLAIGKDYKQKINIVFCVFFAVLIMCFFTNYSALLLMDLSEVLTSTLGSIILIFVGFYNLFTLRKKQSDKKNTITFIVAGFAVGLDGAMANLSLSLMGINTFFVPLVIAVMHAIMVSAGIILSGVSFSIRIKKYRFFAPLVLIALGVYKLVGVFR